MTKSTFINTKNLDIKTRESIQPQTRVLAEIVYGLSSRNCKGMGICKINAVQNPDQLCSNTPCGSSLAYLEVIDASSIRFDFLIDTIDSVQVAERFANGFFLLEEPFYFSPLFAKKLLACGDKLVAGKYPVQFHSAFVAVEFSQAYSKNKG